MTLSKLRNLRLKAVPMVLAFCVVSLSAVAQDRDEYWGRVPATPLASNQYVVTDVAVNAGSGAANVDKNLVNPWGLSRSSASPWWVSDNGTGLSTLYLGTGAVQGLVVTIPPASTQAGTVGSPTGTIYNGTTEFVLPNGNPAVFLFATEDGTISGWNGGSAAVITVNEAASGASFKGLAAAVVNIPGYQNTTLLYAADFTNGRVEVFDGSFKHVGAVERRFNDDVDLPYGYAPFNVQNLGGNIYVAYAKRGRGNDEQDGQGLGFVRIYSASGSRLLQLEHGDFLNAPWGLAIAPSDFGPYSHSILVGNFGSGWVAAFDPVTGRFQDFLRDKTGAVLALPGLWALSPGNDGKAGNATAIYFAAGGAAESTGVLGTITAAANPLGNGQ